MYITPQGFLPWGVFCENCGTINKEEYCCFNHIIISIFERDVLKEILSASDSEMDRRAVEAVKAAINKAKICKNR